MDSRRPRSVIGAMGSASMPAPSRTDSDTSSVDPNSLFSASMRKATFTTSPITVYSLRSADPTLPMIAGPACKAMPIRVGDTSPAEMRRSSSRMISAERVRALARGEYGELHIGYIPIPTAEILPPALEAFRKAVPHVKPVLHDLPTDELIAELRNATLELAIMVQPIGEQTAGIE